MKPMLKGTLIVAMVFTALGIFWMFAAMMIPVTAFSDTAGPRLLPLLAGGTLTFISLLLIGQTLLASRRKGPDSTNDDKQDDEIKIQHWRTLGGFAVLLLFIALLENLHFFINTAIVSALGLAISGEPLKPRLLLYALIISGIAYALFIYLLQIPLPGSRYM
jgi:hypothetical protein